MSADEAVALYDPLTSRPIGLAPRWRVRRENLPHAATAVVVRRSSGEVLVHRRSTTKDLWPGLLDCAFGGVLLADEDPDAAARRELAEEAGIDDPALVFEPVHQGWFQDDSTWYLAFVHRVVWDGDVRFDDGEVAEAWWETPGAVAALVAGPASPFVPDTRALLTRVGVDTVLR